MCSQPSQSNDFVHAQVVPEQLRGPIRIVVEPPRTNWVAFGVKWLLSGLLMLFGLMLFLGVIAAFASLGENEAKVNECWHSLSKTAKRQDRHHQRRRHDHGGQQRLHQEADRPCAQGQRRQGDRAARRFARRHASPAATTFTTT